MASVKLILLQDVENLGLAGEEIHVAPGYARNFLIPRGLASRASQGTLRMLASRKEKIEEKRRQDLEKAQKLAETIAQTEISIPMQASDDDQLFGSVTARIISDKLKEKGLMIEHGHIHLPGQIRTLGVFDVDIKLHTQVTTKAKIWVVRA